MSRRAMGAIVAAAVLMVGVTACGDDEGDSTQTTTDDALENDSSGNDDRASTQTTTDDALENDSSGNDDGDSMPVAADGEFGRDGFPVDGGGLLQMSEPGCWTVDGVMAAWAPGSSIDESDRTAATPEGEAVADGSFVRITGFELSTGQWPGGSDGRWARHADDCGFSSWGMVLVETMEIDPFDPQVTTEAELAALVAETTLTSAGGCGYQFTAANADDTVGLIVSDSSRSEAAASGELPDDRFEVTVRVGSRLFEQWCTDVLYPFADPFTAARWPVTAGRFDFEATDDYVVSFTLTDAVVDSPAGPIPLGTITMTNSCYSCIPG